MMFKPDPAELIGQREQEIIMIERPRAEQFDANFPVLLQSLQ